MKNIIAILGLFLFFVSCTPADRAVTDAKTRQMIQEQGRKRSGGGGSKPYLLGGYQLASFLMDKQVEAVEILRLALEIDDGRASNSQKKDKLESPEGHSAILSLNSVPLNFSTERGDFELKTIRNFKMVLTQSPTKENLILNVSPESPLKLSLDRKGNEKTYINVFEKTFELKAEVDEKDSAIITVQLTSSGEMNGLVQKTSFKEAFEVRVDLKLDRASLEKSEVKVLSSSAEMALKKADGKIFKVVTEAQDLKLVASGLCNTLIGNSLIKSDRSGKKIYLSEEGAKISDTNIVFKLASCGKRPTIDLSRFIP